jgi:N-acyl-D-amino-acid deacylase
MRVQFGKRCGIATRRMRRERIYIPRPVRYGGAMPDRKTKVSNIGCSFWSCAFVLLSAGLAIAAEDQPMGPERIRQAVEAGLRTIEKSSAEYPEHRSCFSCHHQTLPMQTMVSARKRGFKVNEAILRDQAQLTYDFFKARLENLRSGTGIGGRAMTVSFGLWALDLGNWKSDDITSAMVSFLLKNQEADGHFSSNLNRPPLEDSIVTSTAVVAYYMQKFGPADQKAEVERSVNSARDWLLKAPVSSQEDRNSKLWGLNLLAAGKEHAEKARKEIWAAQRADGGWAQLAGMQSDAYATGQTLFVLEETGTPAAHPGYQRGVRFLLETQLKDGSWFVKTRSKPVQTFFDSGFPHGKDQFISISATSWAVAALAAANVSD